MKTNSGGLKNERQREIEVACYALVRALEGFQFVFVCIADLQIAKRVVCSRDPFRSSLT